MISVMLDDNGKFIVEELTDNGFVRCSETEKALNKGVELNYREYLDSVKFVEHFKPMCAEFIVDAVPWNDEFIRNVTEQIKRMGPQPVTLDMTNETWIWPKGTKLIGNTNDKNT